MTYSKEVTALILSDWVKGASAEETRIHIAEAVGHPIGLATIYRHRHSLTTQDLIDELLRQQERDITKAESKTALHFRNELLKILLPIRVQSISHNIDEHIETEKVLHLHMWRPNDDPADKPSNIPVSPVRETSSIP